MPTSTSSSVDGEALVVTAVGLAVSLLAILLYSRGRAWPISFVAFILSGPVLFVVTFVVEAFRAMALRTRRSSDLAEALAKAGPAAFVVSGLSAALIAAAIYAYSIRDELRAHREFRRLPPLPPRKPMPSAALQSLGLEPHAGLDDLERVYREQAFRLHPDRGGDVQEFKLLQANYERAKRVIALRAPTGRAGGQASQDRPSPE
jgi:hypothetical protein